jgi:transcriptional regulator with XRE-family HTH domain
MAAKKGLVGRIGERLRGYRKDRKLSQEQLAGKAGISVSFLSMIERGERAAHVETIESLADALGVALPTVFDEGARINYPHPSYEKLVIFAQKRNLSPSSVDKLLKLADTALD